MVNYLYTSKPVIDPVTGNLVADASLQFYAEDDLGHTTPLPVTDVTGLPLAAITTNRLGLHAPFIVADEPVGVLSDGTYSVAVDSPRGMLTAAEAAQAAAEATYAELVAYVEAHPGTGTVDHGALSGLAEDDHTQYHTDTRGDARYYPREEAATLIAAAVAAAAPANRDRANHTGTQAISSIVNLESRLAALEAGGGGGGGILLIPEGDDVPVGTPPGLVGTIPSGVGPEPTAFETVSYDSEGTTATCAVPTSVAVGDAVIFIPGFDPATTAGDISVADAGWTEIIDYSGNHTRDTAVYVYRVTDSTALAALGATVTATYSQTARRMAACLVVPGSLVASAWPAYTSGSNRSAATINSNTTTGCVIQSFSTATVPFHKVVAFVMHDAASDPAASAGFTVLGFATGSAGGVAPRTLTIMIKDLAATPVPAATITHSTASSSTHGGGQFIVPVA